MTAQPAADPGAGPHFAITGRDPGSRARTGRLETPHGALDTPAFIFCGTKAAIKGATPAQMRALGTQIILSNTYHLMIQPGEAVVRDLGGLHRFTGWDGPMLTDSGGFQVFSMGHGSVADEIKGRRGQAQGAKRQPTLLSVSEDGARFRSYLDGSSLFLSPERSIEIQQALGADLIVQFDECTAFHDSRDYTARSMEMSLRWGDRCIIAHDRNGGLSAQGHAQGLYATIQGGVYEDLRRACCEYTAEQPFFGTAVGGCLGADKAQMYEVVGYCMPHVHPDRPVHLLGIGGFSDIFEGVAMGIDTFDCVTPTRVARHGWALVKGHPGERMNLRNAEHRTADRPIDETCGCETCRTFSRGYLHHLVRTGEPLAIILLTAHNVATMNRLMAEIRDAVAIGELERVRRAWSA